MVNESGSSQRIHNEEYDFLLSGDHSNEKAGGNSFVSDTVEAQTRDSIQSIGMTKEELGELLFLIFRIICIFLH